MPILVHPNPAHCRAFLSRPNTHVVKFPTGNTFYFSLPLDVSLLHELRLFELFALRDFLSSITDNVQRRMGQWGVENITHVQRTISKWLLHLKHLLHVERLAWAAGHGVPVFDEQDNLISFSWAWDKIHFEKGSSAVAEYARLLLEQIHRSSRGTASARQPEHFKRAEVQLKTWKAERTHAFEWTYDDVVICFGIFGAWFKDKAEWLRTRRDFDPYELVLLNNGLASIYNAPSGGWDFVVSPHGLHSETSSSSAGCDAVYKASGRGTRDWPGRGRTLERVVQPTLHNRPKRAHNRASDHRPEKHIYPRHDHQRGKLQNTEYSPVPLVPKTSYTVILPEAFFRDPDEQKPLNNIPRNAHLHVPSDTFTSLHSSNSSSDTEATPAYPCTPQADSTSTKAGKPKPKPKPSVRFPPTAPYAKYSPQTDTPESPLSSTHIQASPTHLSAMTCFKTGTSSTKNRYPSTQHHASKRTTVAKRKTQVSPQAQYPGGWGSESQTLCLSSPSPRDTHHQTRRCPSPSAAAARNCRSHRSASPSPPSRTASSTRRAVHCTDTATKTDTTTTATNMYANTKASNPFTSDYLHQLSRQPQPQPQPQRTHQARDTAPARKTARQACISRYQAYTSDPPDDTCDDDDDGGGGIAVGLSWRDV